MEISRPIWPIVISRRCFTFPGRRLETTKGSNARNVRSGNILLLRLLSSIVRYDSYGMSGNNIHLSLAFRQTEIQRMFTRIFHAMTSKVFCLGGVVLIRMMMQEREIIETSGRASASQCIQFESDFNARRKSEETIIPDPGNRCSPTMIFRYIVALVRVNCYFHVWRGMLTRIGSSTAFWHLDLRSMFPLK